MIVPRALEVRHEYFLLGSLLPKGSVSTRGRLYRCAQYVPASRSGEPQVGRKVRLGLAVSEQQKVEKAQGLRVAVWLPGPSFGSSPSQSDTLETTAPCLDWTFSPLLAVLVAGRQQN